MRKSETPWWKHDTNNAHKAIVDTIRRLDDEQAYRSELNLHHLRLYSNRLALGLSSTDWATYDQSDKLKLNVVKAVIDAAVAQIATNRTRPMFLTQKGNASQRRRGRALGRFVLGQFHAVNQYDLDQNVFRDACIFGSGFEKISNDRGLLVAERTFPNELIVDDAECRYASPRSLFHVKEIAPEVLEEDYPEAAEVDAAERVRDTVSYRIGGGETADAVESWHLPSSDDAEDGRHVICTSEETLLDERWTRETFPFSKFDWTTAVLGFFGIGIAEELTAIQVEINYILQKVQRLMTLATSQVWVEKGSVTNKSMNNEDFAVREYAGRPPVFMTVMSVSPEYFNQLDRLWNRAFEVTGVSQLNATAQKPAGLDSGEAIRRYTDVTSRRFLHVQQRWETFRNDVAEQMIETARDIEASSDDGYRVVAVEKKGIEELRFADVHLDRDKYVIQVSPVSFLPDTPSGKLQALKEMRDVASPEIQQQLVANMDYPDIEAAASLINAPTELIDLLIERMLEHGEYRPPEPNMALSLAMPRLVLALNRSEVEGEPEERIDLLRRFLSEADALLNPPPAPQAPGVPNAPGAAPIPQQPMAGAAIPAIPPQPIGPAAAAALPALTGSLGIPGLGQ